jgi:phosphatidylglycerol:prolipoprotein diacylglycerol transferase
VAAGFLAGYSLVQVRARTTCCSRETAADLSVLAMIAGIVGARLLYVLQNWGHFRNRLGEIVRIDHGGLVFYGGFIAAAMAVGLFCWRRKLSPLAVGDLFAPALAAGHAFGRVGCFLNGCCFGRPWTGRLGVVYAPITGVSEIQVQQGLLPAAAAQALPVFPVQLVAAVMNAVLCLLLLWLAPRLKRQGMLFGCYVLLYTIGRFLIELARGDYLARVGGVLSPAQILCLVLFPFGVLCCVVAWRRNGRRAGERETDGMAGQREGA